MRAPVGDLRCPIWYGKILPGAAGSRSSEWDQSPRHSLPGHRPLSDVERQICSLSRLLSSATSCGSGPDYFQMVLAATMLAKMLKCGAKKGEYCERQK